MGHDHHFLILLGSVRFFCISKSPLKVLIYDRTIYDADTIGKVVCLSTLKHPYLRRFLKAKQSGTIWIEARTTTQYL